MIIITTYHACNIQIKLILLIPTIKITGHPRAEGFQGVPGELGNQEWWHSIQLTKQS